MRENSSIRETTRVSAPSRKTTTASASRVSTKEHEEDRRGPAPPARDKTVPAQPGQRGRRQRGQREELRGVTKLAKARQDGRQPPVNAAVRVPKIAVAANGVGIDRVEGAEVGQPVANRRGARRDGQSTGHPDRAGVPAQASQQAQRTDHSEPDTPGGPAPDRERAQRQRQGQSPQVIASAPTPVGRRPGVLIRSPQ